MRIRSIELYRHQRGGYRCTIVFAHTTAAQFTDEESFSVRDRQTVVGALWATYRAARAVERKARPKKGEREAKGWN